MHEDAGVRRRRRLLLLFHRHGTTTAPVAPLAVPPAAVDEESVPAADRDLLRLCGVDPNVTLVVEDLARRPLREQPLDFPALTIGRGPHNDLWLNHDRILSRHALLVWLEGSVFFTALSPKAELLGPKGPMSSGWWTPNLCVRTGAFRLQLRGLKKAPPSFDPFAPSLAAELPRLELRFKSAASAIESWPVTRPLTLIGRSPICKVRVDHESILPVHAALIRTAGRLGIVNLSDVEHVQVNGTAVMSAVLDVGDQIRCGVFRFEVQAAAEWPAEPAPQNTSLSTASATEAVLRDFADKHQKLLETHLLALKDLERLASQTSDPRQLKVVLDVLQRTSQAIGEGKRD